MSPIWDSILQFCLAALWRASWQGSVAILAVLAIECCWKNVPVVWRSWMWRCVFLKLVIAMLIPGSVSLPVLPAQSMNTSEIIGDDKIPAEPASRTAHGSAGASPSQQTAPSQQSLSLQQLLSWTLVGLWAMGFTGYLSLQQWHGRRVMKRLEQSRVVLHRAVERMLQTLSTSAGLAQPPQVRVSPGMGSPCVIGGSRPVILLPMEWLRICTHNQLRLVIAHEMAHLARGDLAWNQFAAICQAAFFFHPLVWLAARRYHLAQEMACDELALGRTHGSPAEYARLLLQFVEQRTEPHWAGAVSMTGATVTLRERILAMNRVFQSTSTAASSYVTASLLAILGFVPMSLAEQNESQSSSEPKSASTQQSAATEKSSSVVKKSASASASASSSASGFGAANGIGVGQGAGAGNGVGGNNGVGKGQGKGLAAGRAKADAAAKAEVKAQVSVSVSTDHGEAKQPAEPSTSQPKSQTKPNSSTSKSSMKQSMKSSNTGDGEKWTRTTEATENDKEFKVVETQDQITITIKEGSNENKFAAANAKELAAKHPEAYEVYKKYGAPKGTASTKITKGGIAGGKSGGFAGGIAGGEAGGLGALKGLGDLKGIDLEGLDLKEFGAAGGLGDGKTQAKELMKQELKKILESDEVRGTPLEKLIEEAQKQFEDE